MQGLKPQLPSQFLRLILWDSKLEIMIKGKWTCIFLNHTSSGSPHNSIIIITQINYISQLKYSLIAVLVVRLASILNVVSLIGVPSNTCTQTVGNWLPSVVLNDTLANPTRTIIKNIYFCYYMYDILHLFLWVQYLSLSFVWCTIHKIWIGQVLAHQLQW